MSKYLIYRVYSKKERPDTDNRAVLYGWTNSKDVAKAFMKQRSSDKYHLVKLSDEELEEKTTSDEFTDSNTMIDYVRLKSAKTHEEVSLFITRNELKEAELSIQSKFHEMSSIARITGNGDYLNMIFNLDDYYLNALIYLGYRPPELDILYPSADERDNFSTLYDVEESIEEAYAGMSENPPDGTSERYQSVPGLMTISDVASKIIYSLESFIKVLINDL